jgi:hypothetical protein
MTSVGTEIRAYNRKAAPANMLGKAYLARFKTGGDGRGGGDWCVNNRRG